jgi:hypothetical protein
VAPLVQKRMAGVATHPTGRASRRAHRAVAIAFSALALCAALLAAGSASPGSAGAARKAVTCPPQPYGLAPGGTAAERFTMMIRINTEGNVATWTKPDGGMGGRIRPQDIFVINTRFEGSGNGQYPPVTDPVASQLAAELRATFPCNRIVALNGMSFDPASPGYAFAMIGDPNAFAVLTDFEQGDWNAGRATDPGRPPWNEKFKKALKRIKRWDAGLAATAAGNPIGAGKRTGLVPQDVADWNYGQIAQDLNKKNSRLGSRKLGPLTVQTQDSCAEGGAAGFGARAKNLRLQYTFKFITKKIKVKGRKKKRTVTIRQKLKKRGRPNMSNLAMEISFTDSPDARASQAILSTSAAQAASCVQPALKQGAGAFFFFAAEDGMRELFQQPLINSLRPATTPPASGGGGTGGVGL